MTFQEFVEKLMAYGSLADKIVEPTTRAAALKPMGINAGSPISNAINQVFNDANCMMNIQRLASAMGAGANPSLRN